MELRKLGCTTGATIQERNGNLKAGFVKNQATNLSD